MGNIHATGDFVDYQRLAFNPSSVENTPTYKKKSVPHLPNNIAPSGSPTHRKASAGAFKIPTPTSVPHRHNSTGHYSAAVEASIRNLSQSPPRRVETFAQTFTAFQEPPAPKPADRSPQEPKGTHFTFPDSCLETYMDNMDAEAAKAGAGTEIPPNSSQFRTKSSMVMEDEEADEELQSAVPFASIAPEGPQNTRSNADTPTLTEEADHLQTLLTLSSPSPTHLAEPVRPVVMQLTHSAEPTRRSSSGVASATASASTTPRHKGLSNGNGLKGLLQRNIEASALAVYELQEQQRIRERPRTVHGATADQPSSHSVPVSPGLSVQAKGAGGGATAASVRPPVHARPSSSKASVRNGRQKTKEIDWAGPAIIPVYVAPAAAASNVSHPGSLSASPVTATELSALPVVATDTTKNTTAMANFEETIPRVPSRQENLQLPVDGNVNLTSMLLASLTGQPQPSHAQDDVVVLKSGSGNSTPFMAPRTVQPDMAVAGQRRSNILKKEKVTNAKLFM